MNLDLSTDAAPSPERTRHLAETMAEIVRVLCHTTMHHEALGDPSDADRVLRELASTTARLPQLLDQVARWHAIEDGAGRITVPSGDWAGRPHTAVATLQVRLEAARSAAMALSGDLDHAAHVTAALALREDESNG